MKFESLKIFLLLIMLTSLSGCWDRTELNRLAITTGLAFDASESLEEITMTAQVLDLGSLGPASQGTTNEIPFWNIKVTGHTVFDCIRNASMQSPHKLYLAHNQVVIFSEELARQKGIEEYIDFFLRDAKPRVSTWILVTPGRAADVLDIKTKVEPIPAINISYLIENRKATGKAAAVDLFELSSRAISEVTAPVASLISIVGDKENQNPLLSGTAVFNRDLEMIGKLNARETRGMLWVIDELEGGVILIDSPVAKGHISIEILNSHGSIEPEIKNGEVKIKVIINEQGNLVDVDHSLNPLADETWLKLNRQQEEEIRKDIKMALSKAQSLNADIFGFGDAIYKKYPQTWKTIKADWGEIFPSLKVEIEVKSNLLRPGKTLETINQAPSRIGKY